MLVEQSLNFIIAVLVHVIAHRRADSVEPVNNHEGKGENNREEVLKRRGRTRKQPQKEGIVRRILNNGKFILGL